MLPVILQTESAEVAVPEWVVDLESFRRWMDAEDVPEQARISYIDDRVWVDMSKEQVFHHVLVKTKIAARLSILAEEQQLGLFLSDGLRFTNLEVNFSVRPDATFASQKALASGRVKLVEGMEEGYVELEGIPDMVMEVVSPSSVRKDTDRLRERYWQAGIREYWLVDARKEPLSFDILRHTARRYTAARKQDGWVRSVVFEKSFRLTGIKSRLGHPDFTFEVR